MPKKPPTLHHAVPDSITTAAGKAMWESVASKYELRPDELAILENACAASDMISALTAVWLEAGGPSITKGSMGQEVIHPLVGEIRAQRAYRDQALGRLKLPDLDAAAPANQNRDAAQSSWQPGVRGRGA